MLLVGLTGSIGMGKSETAKMFARHGVPVCDSDATVHALYDKGGAAVEAVGAAFPGVVVDGRVDREKLSREVVGNPEALRKLELIVHPLVGEAQRAALQAAAASGASMVVLDIPLLFETGGRARVDVVVVVSAPADVQRQRVLARPGMTPEKLEAILLKQMPDADKRARADFVVDTSLGLAHAEAQVVAIIDALKHREGKIWTSNHA
ncbi:MAG: dephospho-CoA kinase [Alphaproteobacteria bacterium]|jgi:dephospho-CoA kinase|nr:dephospho-CoA kinase [Alphaproteobacteria bacterium]